MGTRASFWIGDPATNEREWLGCIAFDGHRENFKSFALIKTAQEFRDEIERLSKDRDDFAFPSKGWPFPWKDDIFMTDRTYAYFNGKVNIARFHEPFIPMSEAIIDHPLMEDDPNHKKVSSNLDYDPSQPDSIMFMRSK